MYRIDIGGNLRELLFDPAEVQKPWAKVLVILILLIKVCGVGQVRPQEHFLNRDTHTHIGAPALVPFELIQT